MLFLVPRAMTKAAPGIVCFLFRLIVDKGSSEATRFAGYGRRRMAARAVADARARNGVELVWQRDQSALRLRWM